MSAQPQNIAQHPQQAQPPRPQGQDAAIEQVRALLFGQAQAETTDRIEHLEDLLREFDRTARTRMEMIEKRIGEERARADARRKADLETLAESLVRLADDVLRLADH